MRIEPIDNNDGTQHLKGNNPFFAVGWIQGSDTVWKITNAEEYLASSSYNQESGEMVQNRITNAQVFNGYTILGFGWETSGMELDGHDWIIVDQSAFDLSFTDFINEVENVEGLIIPPEELE